MWAMAVCCLALVGCRERRSVMFVGDSNTHFLACSYPKLWQARHDVETFIGYDEGVFGTSAEGWLKKGLLAPRLAAHQPREVVIALGTNDVLSGRPYGAILSDLASLYQQVEAYTLADGTHPMAFIATVPPLYDAPTATRPPTEQLQSVVRAVNFYVRIRFPRASVIDFDSWMPSTWDATMMLGPTDGIHLGCAAHAIRADLVDAAL